MRLRTIYEADQITPQPEATPAVERRFGLLPETIRKLGSINPSTLIDSGVAGETWAWLYSAEYGLFMSSQNGYHNPLIQSRGPTVRNILRNIYFGGEQDQTTKRVDYKKAQPGCAGRIGHMLKVEGKWQDVWLINFYDTGAAWYGNAIKEIVKAGHAPDTAMVSNPENGQILSATEFLAKHPPKAYTPPAPVAKPPVAPAKKTWQGELAKTANPGQKWWAPTSEGKL